MLGYQQLFIFCVRWCIASFSSFVPSFPARHKHKYKYKLIWLCVFMPGWEGGGREKATRFPRPAKEKGSFAIWPLVSCYALLFLSLFFRPITPIFLWFFLFLKNRRQKDSVMERRKRRKKGKVTGSPR